MTFEEYTHHIDWSLTVGRQRTARQAASIVRELEGAQALLEAEEAIDDPLRMARSLPAGKAVAGIVNVVDREHREVVTANRAPRRAAGQAIARSFWSDGGPARPAPCSRRSVTSGPAPVRYVMPAR